MTDKFIGDGARLSDYEREILTILIEEANEVAQAACKLLRFGAGNIDPSNGIRNNVTLALEIGDFRHMQHLVSEAGLINSGDVLDGEERKARRLETYLQSARPAAVLEWWAVLQIPRESGAATIRQAYRLAVGKRRDVTLAELAQARNAGLKERGAVAA